MQHSDLVASSLSLCHTHTHADTRTHTHTHTFMVGKPLFRGNLRNAKVWLWGEFVYPIFRSSGTNNPNTCYTNPLHGQILAFRRPLPQREAPTTNLSSCRCNTVGECVCRRVGKYNAFLQMYSALEYLHHTTYICAKEPNICSKEPYIFAPKSHEFCESHAHRKEYEWVMSHINNSCDMCLQLCAMTHLYVRHKGCMPHPYLRRGK